MTDASSLLHNVQNILPDEIYNLAAQSHVNVSLKNQNIQRIQTL